MAIEQMKCYSELEHLFYRVYPALKNFPASEKYCLCQEIKFMFLESLKSMSLASSVKSKRKQYLYEAESNLQHLSTLKFNWLTYTNNQFKINPDLLERLNKGTK